MATIAPDKTLPTPGTVTVRGAPLRRSTGAGPLLFSATPDAQLVPRVLDLAYVDVPGPVADAIRRHYREHRHRTFLWTLPRTAEVVSARHLSPPTIQWSSDVSASASVTLEIQLAK